MKKPVEGMEVKIARLVQGYRQADIQSLTFGKVKQPRISAIERGMPPTPDEAAALKELLGVEIARDCQ